MTHDEKPQAALPLDQLRQLADAVATELSAHAGNAPDEQITNTGGGSLHRGLPEELRERFILVRGALYQRGVFEPVLARFDTATAPQATTLEVAERLAAVAESLTPAGQ